MNDGVCPDIQGRDQVPYLREADGRGTHAVPDLRVYDRPRADEVNRARERLTELAQRLVAARDEPRSGGRGSHGAPASASSIAIEASALIDGPRQSDYGSPVDNMRDIASVWSVIFRCPISPHQVALAMGGLKLVREANKPKRDNRVDGIAYWDIADRCVRDESVQPHDAREDRASCP